MIFRAIRPIAKGEDLTVSYTYKGDVDQRTAAIEELWGFRCQCELCLAQRSASAAAKKRRCDLVEEGHAFLRKHHPLSPTNPPPTPAVMKNAESLTERLTSLYAAAKYDGLPRRAELRLRSWLVEAHLARQDFNKCLNATAALFRALAYEVVFDGKSITLRARKNAVLVREAVEALCCARNVMIMRGNTSAATKLNETARVFYLILNGVPNGFPEVPSAVMRATR